MHAPAEKWPVSTSPTSSCQLAGHDLLPLPEPARPNLAKVNLAGLLSFIFRFHGCRSRRPNTPRSSRFRCSMTR